MRGGGQMKKNLERMIIITAYTLLLSFLLINIAFSESNISKRWIFISSGLETFDEVSRLKSIIIDAKKYGFNGVLFSGSFDSIDYKGETYISKLILLKKFCDLNEMELVPRLFSVGYAYSLIYYEKNMAAAYPITGQSFSVKKGYASADSITQPKNFSMNFEGIQNNILPDFYLQDLPGVVSVVDQANKYSGTSSIKLQNFLSNKNGNGRLGKMLTLKPNNSYEVSFWLKASNWPDNTPVSVQISSEDGSRRIGWKSIIPTSEWKQFTLEFNSIDNAKARLALGVWNGKNSGQLWIDDLQVTNATSINRLVRHAGAPLVIKNPLDGTTYLENTDYVIEEDPELSEVYRIAIKSDGRIREDQLLNVSYYRSYVMGDGQICGNMALSDFSLKREKQLAMITTLIKPNFYFLAADEIRQGGYCQLSKDLSMSQIFGNYITRQYNNIKKYNSSAEVLISGDMLDPNVNAVKNYQMTRGGFEKSWLYVPKEIIPSVWDYNKRDAGLNHFKQNGFRAVVSVNIDGSDSSLNMQNWKVSIDKAQVPFAIVYTTWKNDYSKLSDFSGFFFQ